MALNYDPVVNRIRTFRFHHGNDLESLRQERIQDVFNIEEFGEIHRKMKQNTFIEYFGTLLVQPFHFAFGRTAHFKGLHPYLRVTLRTLFIFAPLFTLRKISRLEMEELYKEMLGKRVNATYEDSLTAKYEILRT